MEEEVMSRRRESRRVNRISLALRRNSAVGMWGKLNRKSSKHPIRARRVDPAKEQNDANEEVPSLLLEIPGERPDSVQ